MAFTSESLRGRARRAYELGRLRQCARLGLVVAALGMFETWVTHAGLKGFVMALLAAATSVGCAWYGRDLGRGVWPGAVVGAAATALALLGRVCVDRIESGPVVEALLPCLLCGFVIGAAGALYGRRGARPLENLLTWVAVAAVATPLALIACLGFGVGGVVGLFSGVVAVGGPIALRTVRGTSG